MIENKQQPGTDAARLRAKLQEQAEQLPRYTAVHRVAPNGVHEYIAVRLYDVLALIDRVDLGGVRPALLDNPMMTNRLDLYPPPGAPSNPATWEDIERLSLHYPAARHAVTLVRRGELTREQALVVLVYALAEAFQKLFKAEVDRRMIEPSKPFINPERRTMSDEKAAGGVRPAPEKDRE